MSFLNKLSGSEPIRDSGDADRNGDTLGFAAIPDNTGDNTGDNTEPRTRRKYKPRAPRSGAGDSADAGTVKRSEAGKSRKTVSLDLSVFTAALVGLHSMAAAAMQNDAWNLTEGEAEGVKIAIENVARHYPQINDNAKIVDWTMLAGSLAAIYVPRIIASRPQKKQVQHAE